jgi:hypothetical protein
MAKERSSEKTTQGGGFSGEDQPGPVGSNAPHGRSNHSDPGMDPGISQAAKEARKTDENEEIDDEAQAEQQRKEASTERD